jgi:hypothetical protein
MRIDPDVIEASRPDDREIALLAAEVRRLQAVINSEEPTLTDAEWDEIEGMISDYQEIAEFNEERCHPHYAEKARRRAAMLIGLLERLG